MSPAPSAAIGSGHQRIQGRGGTLGGGLTAANQLHGSANPIGGQNQVIKLRWGAGGEAMKFAEAPQGIKFALGENVKQSNWGDGYTNRYPQSRMGVEQIIRDANIKTE